MSKVAIIYHSGFGHTDVLARDVAQGVTDAGATADLLRIEGGQAEFGEFFDRIADADAIIFGSPTYMGTVSAPMKAFMDASAKVYFTKQWKDKLGAAFTVSGSPSGDKLNTLTSLAIFAAQHGMLWIGTGQNPGNNDDLSAATDAENRLGSFIGAMAQAANDAPDVTPRTGDRATARSLGHRVALAAARWRTGAVEPAMAG
jgi:NAD(P)H dehydrogenase (quinone)